jgi:hypothetical protein
VDPRGKRVDVVVEALEGTLYGAAVQELRMGVPAEATHMVVRLVRIYQWDSSWGICCMLKNGQQNNCVQCNLSVIINLHYSIYPSSGRFGGRCKFGNMRFVGLVARL